MGAAPEGPDAILDIGLWLVCFTLVWVFNIGMGVSTLHGSTPDTLSALLCPVQALIIMQNGTSLFLILPFYSLMWSMKFFIQTSRIQYPAVLVLMATRWRWFRLQFAPGAELRNYGTASATVFSRVRKFWMHWHGCSRFLDLTRDRLADLWFVSRQTAFELSL